MKSIGQNYIIHFNDNLILIFFSQDIFILTTNNQCKTLM